MHHVAGMSCGLVQVRFGVGATGTAPGAHARGSHLSRLVDEAFGAAIAPVDELEFDGIEVVVLGGVTEVWPEVGGAGGLTENCVPVATVTCAPSVTLAGS
jgi:hypothetical protein